MAKKEWTPTKRYVSVQAIHMADGEVYPLMLRHHDLGIFHITGARRLNPDEETDREPDETVYKVWIRGKATYLYEQNGRWSVKEKIVF